MTASRAVRRAREGFDDFVHSKPYIILIAAVAYVLWWSENLLAAIAVLGVIGGLVLALVRDIVPMIPFVTMAPCMVHINKMPGELWQYALALLPVAAGLVIHLVCYKRNKLEWRKTNLLPSVLLVAAMALGGLFSSAVKDGTVALVNVLYVGVMPVALYIFVKLYGEVKCRPGDYAASVMVIWGILTAVQAVTVIGGARAEGIDIASNSYVPGLGWGNSNVYPTVLMMCMAFNFYFMCKSWKFLLPYALLTGVQFMCVLYAHSRGALIFTIIVLAAGVIAVTVYNRKNPLYWAVLIAVLTAVALLLTFYWERLSLIMGNTFSDKLQSSGRDYLYIEAMDKFLENPLFGAGFGYVGLVEHLHTESGFYQFHSTVFQTLGSMGLAGLAVMIYVYVMRYYTVFCGAKRAKIFFFIAMIGFEGYSLINTSTFTGLPCMTVIYMMLALFELDRAHDKGEIPLGETLKQLLCRRRQVWKKKRA